MSQDVSPSTPRSESNSDKLRRALKRLGRLRSPSVVDLLKRHNYAAEAEVIQEFYELIDD